VAKAGPRAIAGQGDEAVERGLRACSFSADTEVATKTGEKPISTVKTGDIEIRVAKALKAGEAIEYAVKPFDPQGSDTFVPEFIAIGAYGNHGTNIVEVILNAPRR
jgi:hypothetical protein